MCAHGEHAADKKLSNRGGDPGRMRGIPHVAGPDPGAARQHCDLLFKDKPPDSISSAS